MKTITVKIPETLANDIDTFTRQTGTKKWVFVAAALHEFLAVPKTARLTRMSDYAKSVGDAER